MNPCPKCGHPAEAPTCETCGHGMGNGTARRVQGPVQKPPAPPELAGVVFEQTPPDMIEEVIQTFNEDEWLALLREVEKTGGVKFEDFIGEIKQIVNRRA